MICSLEKVKSNFASRRRRMVKAVKLMITWALTACPTSSEEAAGIVLLEMARADSMYV